VRLLDGIHILFETTASNIFGANVPASALRKAPARHRFMLTRAAAPIFFNINATDPLTFGVVAVLLGGVALLACFIPARRATRIDPIVALRHE